MAHKRAIEEIEGSQRKSRSTRKDMTPLSRVWTYFILSNIYPIYHSSDLLMTKAFLAYCIQHKLVVDVATILSDELYQFVIREPSNTRVSTKPLVY
ncbi:hypothetical protein TanjilG_19841 [Lupinus angustifolius]|uniref:Putative plant transposon protein domain-containing protein n=1 Tax=Lupinus angustifolius TaxID=3871 RepID=A0A1J7GKE2_LUPAN|nr:hypothetical protein TanjilG_19841 [Lupinus angustifolius]